MDAMSIEFPNESRETPKRDNEILPRATIEMIVKNRDLALKMHSEAYDLLAIGKDAVKAAHVQGQKAMLGKTRYNEHVSAAERDKHAHSAALAAKDVYMADQRKVLDTDVWSAIVKTTDLERLMDKKSKDRLKQDLLTDPPEVTIENIRATLEQFILDADTIFKRGIAECFSALDRRFKSHDGWKIGSRIILSYAFDSNGNWSWSRSHDDTLRDIERVFLTLDGVPPTASYGGIVDNLTQARRFGSGPRQSLFENDYFRVRAFKNGNCHIWLLRDDLTDRVNRLLGEYYGAPIPEEQEAEKDTGLHTPKTSLAKNFGFFPTPPEAANRALRGVSFLRRVDLPPLRVLEPQAGTGNLARRALNSIAELDNWSGGRERYQHEYRYDNQVDCVEIQTALAAALKAEGIFRKVYNCDFLILKPQTTGKYHKVLMNPPFDRERDIDHVIHAWDFLEDDGELVAIMSAGTEFRETRKSEAFRAFVKQMNGDFSELPPGSFSPVGTNCNTTVLRVNKNGKYPRWWPPSYVRF